MNETAVDWLFQKLWDNPKDKLTWYKILIDAKEIERKQIVEAHGYQRNTTIKANGDILLYLKNGEEYYKENYGKL